MKIAYGYKSAFLICAIIMFFASCQSKEERMKEKLRVEAEKLQRKEQLRIEQQERKELEKKKEFKNVQLSRVDAYNELISYNKIYNWKFEHVSDKNYEPTKIYKYNNSPELKMSPFELVLKSYNKNPITYEVIEYEAYKLINGYDSVERTTFIFKLRNGEATFYDDTEWSYINLKNNETGEFEKTKIRMHTFENPYFFSIKLNNNISITFTDKER